MRSNVAASIHRGLERSIYRPPFVYAIVNGIREEIELVRPFGNGVGLAVVGNKPIVSFISYLGFMVCPAAIFRRIHSVIVNAVDGLSRLALPHIPIKFVKRVEPRVADGNTSSPVPVKVHRAWVGAARFHATPNRVFPGLERPVTCGVSETPTRGAKSFFQPPRCASNYGPTMADAKPCGTCASIISYRRYNKNFSKKLKRQVGRLFGYAYNFIRHFGTSSIECLGGRGLQPSSADYTPSGKFMYHIRFQEVLR